MAIWSFEPRYQKDAADLSDGLQCAKMNIEVLLYQTLAG